MRRRIALTALLVATLAPLTVHSEPQTRSAFGDCASMGPALGACGARDGFAQSGRLPKIKTLNEREGRPAMPMAPPRGATASAMAPIELRLKKTASASRTERAGGSAQAALGRTLRRGAFLALLLSGERLGAGN